MRGPFANSFFRNRRKLAIFSGLKFSEYKISTGLTAYASIVDPAFIWIGGVGAPDLSGYADTDRKIVLTDTTDKKCTAYCGPVCGGLTYGAELLGNTEFEDLTYVSPNAAASILSVAGGASGNCLEITKTGAGYSSAWVGNTATGGAIVLTPGRVYYHESKAKSGTAGDTTFRLYYEGAHGQIDATSTGDWSAHGKFFTRKSTGISGYYYLIKTSETAGTILFDQSTLKPVSDGPTTGIQLLSSPGGAVGVESTESGFDANLITEVRIYG
jgi:hypothetical protein